MQKAADAGVPELTWIVLSGIGLMAACTLYWLERAGRLQPGVPLNKIATP
jgi:hypothetical protein